MDVPAEVRELIWELVLLTPDNDTMPNHTNLDVPQNNPRVLSLQLHHCDHRYQMETLIPGSLLLYHKTCNTPTPLLSKLISVLRVNKYTYKEASWIFYKKASIQVCQYTLLGCPNNLFPTFFAFHRIQNLRLKVVELFEDSLHKSLSPKRFPVCLKSLTLVLSPSAITCMNFADNLRPGSNFWGAYRGPHKSEWYSQVLAILRDCSNSLLSVERHLAIDEITPEDLYLREHSKKASLGNLTRDASGIMKDLYEVWNSNKGSITWGDDLLWENGEERGEI